MRLLTRWGDPNSTLQCRVSIAGKDAIAIAIDKRPVFLGASMSFWPYYTGFSEGGLFGRVDVFLALLYWF